MQKEVESVLALMESDHEDWLWTLKETIKQTPREQRKEFFLALLKEVLQKELAFEMLEELIVFWERDHTSYTSFAPTLWFNSVVLYGNQEAFSYLLEWNIQGEDSDFYTIDCIFTLGVKHNCLERLVKWLQEEMGIFEVFDGYLLQIDDNYQKLSPTEEEIGRIMLRVLDCSPADLPKPRSVLLQNWLLSLREDV